MSRNIEPDMLKYINLKLGDSALAAKAFSDEDPRALFTETCKSLWGVREVGGNNEGPIVELMQKTIGESWGEPWCMAMIQTCLAYVETSLGIPSPVVASEHCLTVWDDTPAKNRVKEIPEPGAIAIWNYQHTSNGHTGCVLKVNRYTFNTVEGNTEGGENPDGKIIRDGGGVYYATRVFDPIGRMKLLGFLKPF